jgi:DNA invertase Pin-like site-specific DNA recombinase
MNLGYIRVSTDKQTVENQKSEILKYAQTKELLVNDFIELEISSRKSYTKRKIDLLLETLKEHDNLFVSELSRLGRSTKEVLDITEKLMDKGIIVHFIKQNIILDKNNQNDIMSKVMITLFGLFAELERDLVGQRTKSALDALKAKGVKLGKPTGVKQKSILDEDRNKILELLNLGLTPQKIATSHINCKGDTLRKWIKKNFDTKTDNLTDKKTYKFSKEYQEFIKREYNNE